MAPGCRNPLIHVDLKEFWRCHDALAKSDARWRSVVLASAAPHRIAMNVALEAQREWFRFCRLPRPFPFKAARG